MKKITVPDIIRMKKERKKIAVLTAYTYSMARILDRSGIPIVLVGDSVGMVEAGYATTLPVTMEEMLYHTRAVSRACERALVVGDMPFMSYQAGIEDAVRNAGRFIKEGGAEAVKLEGGVNVKNSIKAITSADIPVMAHIGLLPQSIHRMGGYKVQGKGKKDEERLLKDALAAEEAGAFSVVLECIPERVAARITKALGIPTIGIGAGRMTTGQVLVVNDMLGLNSDKKPPRFVKKYAKLEEVIKDAVIDYKEDVEKGGFPSKCHCY